jgi:hypothetical protein
VSNGLGGIIPGTVISTGGVIPGTVISTGGVIPGTVFFSQVDEEKPTAVESDPHPLLTSLKEKW